MAGVLYLTFVLCLDTHFQFATASAGAPLKEFWAVHILNEHYSGPANKDLGNQECVDGFVAFYCFGQQTAFSDYNSEEHVDHGNVLENVYVKVWKWGTNLPENGYLSCCPPGSKTNPKAYYRCNSWTSETNDNCHTTPLPWNDGKIKAVGAVVPSGAKPVQEPSGSVKQWMYSFPAEGEGNTWRQGVTRRVFMHDLARQWADEAGGCSECSGKAMEDPCYGKCIGKLPTWRLIQSTNQAFADNQKFPDHGVPGCEGLIFGGTHKCIDLSGGDSAYGTPIDIWECNGLVNQAWYWAQGRYTIELGGHNVPGMCIDLPGGDVFNGNTLWIWGCNGGDSQKWSWDAGTSTIRYAKDTRYCIDVPGGNAANGNHLWLWQCTGGQSQKWQIYSHHQGVTSSRSSLPMSTERQANNSNPNTDKPKVRKSWMHEMKHFLAKYDWTSNRTLPPNFVPWYERKEVKDFYAAQMPGPGLPRPLVPAGWKGYNVSNEPHHLLV